MSKLTKANVKPAHKKHHPHEVATSTNDSKLLANALNNANKWQHLMEVTVAGDVTIRPYDPIYLDGLRNGLSGYWTVITVTHKFGSGAGWYVLDLLVGTNVLGETDEKAGSAVAYRDVEAELSGQSLDVADSVLRSVQTSPNETDFPEPEKDGVAPKVVAPVSYIPNPTSNPYAVRPPSVNNRKEPPVWVAKLGSKIIQ